MASADGPARHLCVACEATAPSAALLAFSRLCEAVSQAGGRPLDAEALLPLVSLALAHALVHGRAPHVPAALELASHSSTAERCLGWQIAARLQQRAATHRLENAVHSRAQGCPLGPRGEGACHGGAGAVPACAKPQSLHRRWPFIIDHVGASSAATCTRATATASRRCKQPLVLSPTRRHRHADVLRPR